MKIAVCYKTVPFSEDITVKSDRTLNLDIAWEVGKYDLNAAEAGVKLAAETGGTAVCVTANGKTVADSKLRKAILSRGPAEMYAVQDDALEGADSLTTAKVLKAAIDKIGDVDLVICGEGSGDMYAQQVGNMLGALMGVPTVNAVSGISLEGDKLVLVRNIGVGTEVVKISAPAVISVTSDVNVPRIPTMKDIMGAGKKPFTVWSPADVGVEINPSVEVVSILAPLATERKKVIVDKVDDDAINEFVTQIKKAL